MNITLKPIDKSNWKPCVKLNVHEEQTSFVASNSYSLLQAHYEGNLHPYGIYNNDEMAGFIMYGFDPEDQTFEMCRLMVDKNHQNKGIGKQAILLLLALVRQKEGNIEFYTSTVPGNNVASKLYESFGFFKTGEIAWGEEIMKVQL